jgi:hypothetical protein
VPRRSDDGTDQRRGSTAKSVRLATIVLLLYTATLAHLAEADGSAAELESPTVVVHAALALILLVAATVLAVFKPAGLTKRGRAAARSV